LEANAAMNRIVLRLINVVALVVVGCVLLVLSVGHMLPQEDEIVFAANLDNTDSEIYRMALDRQLVVPLTRNNTEDSQPSWSPDGQEIAFVSDNLGQFTIFLMDAQGRGISQSI
jgi:dipeptidyl aminopeptidase/acylaminoacyl peptidase